MAENNFTDEEFNKIKEEAEVAYKKIGKVFCPYLKQDVFLNTKGLDHLKLKRWNHARERSDQWVRLKLLHLVPEVIKNSHTLQGIDEGNKFERLKVNNRYEKKMAYVGYYEFISIIQKCRIRVVLKKIDTGPIYFWSIVPYWKQGEYRKKMFEGDPETD